MTRAPGARPDERVTTVAILGRPTLARRASRIARVARPALATLASLMSSGKRPTLLAAASALSLAAAPSPSAAADAALRCALPGPQDAVRRVGAPGVAIAWRPAPAPIAVGQPFSVDLAVCADPGPGSGAGAGATPAVERVAIDAWMPAHRHGMNYRPTLAGAPPGPLRFDGLLFHMPGAWQLRFDLQAGERRWRLVDDLVVR